MTRIEWVKNQDGTQGRSWNPVTGCTRISPGCKNCYAERMARRLAGRHGYPEAPNHFDVVFRPDRLEQPLNRRKPTTYFVCSMSDLFHEDVSDKWLYKIFKVMAATDRHTYQILTKKPYRMLEFCQSQWYRGLCNYGLNNIWLGVSVENQATADERREDFHATPAAVKFVSYEPALGPIDWTGWEFIDQLIFGGESGPGARPAHPDWLRSARDWAGEHGIARFFKQWGAWKPIGDFDPQERVYHYSWEHAAAHEQVVSIGPDGKVYYNDYPPRKGWHMARVGKKAAGRLLDGRTWNEMPASK